MIQGRDNVGTAEELLALAGKITGLSDFGDDDFREGLDVLLESLEKEAGLTPIGNKLQRVFVRGALVNRLISEAAFKQYPEHADVRIKQPIFVTGLPRTGTTALHRLLTADPAHQGLEVWLTEIPQPRPPRDTWAADPMFQAIQSGYEQHHIENPEFMGVHYMSADMVEECWQLLRQSFHSISFECLAHIPTYSAWLDRQDWRPAYQRHKKNLQLIGLNDQDKRWVLKNPSHLSALDAIMEIYPDALIIQTHRDPRTAMASMCSLAAHATAGWSERFTGATIGRDQLDLWGRSLERFEAERAKHDPAQFIDVDYADFIRDPLGSVEAVYGHFGMPLTEEARGAMGALHAESRQGAGRPAHSYDLADFGLTVEQIDARFPS